MATTCLILCLQRHGKIFVVYTIYTNGQHFLDILYDLYGYHKMSIRFLVSQKIFQALQNPSPMKLTEKKVLWPMVTIWAQFDSTESSSIYSYFLSCAEFFVYQVSQKSKRIVHCIISENMHLLLTHSVCGKSIVFNFTNINTILPGPIYCNILNSYSKYNKTNSHLLQ